jgi:hypothetical protein
MMIIKEGKEKEREREREREICIAGLEEKCTPPKSSSRPPHCVAQTPINTELASHILYVPTFKHI